MGKTTIAAAIGLLAAHGGRHTIVVEVGDGAACRSCSAPATSAARCRDRAAERLWSITIDPDRALLEWLQELGGRVSGRVLASSGTFQYFAAAAPGAKELVRMVKVWQLARGGRRQRRARQRL